MNNYNNQNAIEEKLNINGIPCLRFYPALSDDSQSPFPTIIYYHGWSSCKDKQRIIAYIFATLGYQVLMPDALYHGERSTFKDYDAVLGKFILPVIMQNIKEFPILRNYIIDCCHADKNRIAVAGHSMGGYTSAGIFTHNSDVKTAVVFNGACDWQNTMLQLEKNYKGLHIDFDESAQKADPGKNIHKIIDRPIFLLHGINDAIVPYNTQKRFYDKIRPMYKNKSKIRFMGVERMNHYISVQMLDEAINWLYTEMTDK